MASGHVNRIKRPNTWLHRPMLQNVKKALANSEPSTHGTKHRLAKGAKPLRHWLSISQALCQNPISAAADRFEAEKFQQIFIITENSRSRNWGECTMSALGTSIPDDACPIDSLGPSLLERCDRCITGVKEDALLRAFGFVVLADLDGRR
jgi:hypothetical protein